MFESSRRKIVVAIMSVLVLLFLGTLGIIYGSSYFELWTANQKMLERYAELYPMKDPQEEDLRPRDDSPNMMMRPGMGNPMDDHKRRHADDTLQFKLSTFYSVAVSGEGEILATDVADGAVYEETTLEKYALEIWKGGKEKGVKGSLIYLVSDKGGYALVVFMDNTIVQGSMTTLFRYTLIFGGVAIAALFFVAVYLARRIVRPLEESYRRQKQFISDAGHELKTPVAVVGANAELLSREIGDNRWLANIQYENERMGKLVAGLLKLARTEQSVRHTERLDFGRLVGGEALPFESVAFEKGVVLHCDIANGVFVDGDGNQLKQLVAILLDNAICHGAGGKEIFLTLKGNHGHATLSVANAGDPIPEEQAEQLFERFYRVDAARNGDGDHYGLGLAIAKAIVTAHRGKIEVHCHDGMVEFTVTLPAWN